jgi:hypothetical protein
VGEFVCVAGENMELWRVGLDEIKEQDVNARGFSPEGFERLSGNMKKDKRIESLPFGVKREVSEGGDPGYMELISGHHRTRAARAAGIDSILFLADTRNLTRSQVVAKQLAHNNLVGEDNDDVLKMLIAELDDIDDMMESYADPELLAVAGKATTPLDVDTDFPYRYMSFAFLPNQMDGLKKLAERLPDNDEIIMVAPRDVFDEFNEVMLEVGKATEVRSVGLMVAKMCEICNEFLDAQD